MFRKFNLWSRRLHRWGAVLTVLPLVLVIVSGLLLQVKKQSGWVQPPTQRGQSRDRTPTISWDELLRIAESQKPANLSGWSDVDRLDVRPGKGIVKVQAKNRWEIQIDLQSGDVLSCTYRRSDLIESLHDGSFFGDWAKLWLFLPNGLVLFGLWLTGIWLWYQPYAVKRRSQAKRRAAASTETLAD